MKQLFVIKAGDTFPDLAQEAGDFEDWIIGGLAQDPDQIEVVHAQKGLPLPLPQKVRGAVISGSHDMVTQDLAWSLALEAWTRQIIAREIPLLGICYGHQIMARAMGGEVDYHPGGAEIGTRQILCHGCCENDLLFKTLPRQFDVHLFHSQSVIRLPKGATLLAGNDFDPHQAFCLGSRAWGVQFHPEADVRVTRGYIRNLEQTLKDQGQDIPRLVAGLRPTPHAAALLRRFGDLVLGQGA